MQNRLLFIVFLTTVFGFSQEKPLTVIDSLYREDQFYLTATYNNLQKFPSGLKQNKLSPGIAIGFLRDMPINKSRTYAIALGAGYSFNQYNYNLYTYSLDGTTQNYEVLSDDVYYDKNRLTLHYIDVPIEFRWRSSTFDSHKFWRIYAGFKAGYLFTSKYQFVNDVQNITIKNNPDLNKIAYGCYVSAGWNTWNIYAYYGLNSLFNSVKIDGKPSSMNTVNVGLQFYIL